MDETKIKTNIRALRMKYKITQTNMAEILGISRTSYRNLECGKTALLHDDVYKIAKILETTTEELVLGYYPIKDIKSLRLMNEAWKEKELGIINKYDTIIDNLNDKINYQNKLIEALQLVIESNSEIITKLKSDILAITNNNKEKETKKKTKKKTKKETE